MKRDDYYGEQAEQHAKEAQKVGTGSHAQRVALGLAQVYATLEVAEQLRGFKELMGRSYT